jgi:hypothetical protein
MYRRDVSPPSSVSRRNKKNFKQQAELEDGDISSELAVHFLWTTRLCIPTCIYVYMYIFLLRNERDEKSFAGKELWRPIGL